MRRSASSRQSKSQTDSCVVARGAEALIYRQGDTIIKWRRSKGYRIREIDSILIRRRTRREAKILRSLPVPGPKLIAADEDQGTICMTYVPGPRLCSVLEKTNWRRIIREVAGIVARLHSLGIIHSDLTTSNMILSDKAHGRVYLIDWGQSFHSEKAEDKAVDLHLFCQALRSRHSSIWAGCMEEFRRVYSDGDVLRRFEQVEARGRNKSKATKIL